MKGIDLSHHNGTVNFDAAKAAGLQFCVIEIGYGQDETAQDDPIFARNVSECERLGIPWGAYLYSYAQSASAAHGEANHAKRLLFGKHPAYVFIDMEDADGYKSRNGGIQDAQIYTDIIKTFCADMAAAGYKAGWYANKDWHENHLHSEQLSGYPFWYARPACGTVESYGQIIVQDQIGETGGTFPGVSGSCDTDICGDGVFQTSGATPTQAAPTFTGDPAVLAYQRKLNRIQIPRPLIDEDGQNGPKTESAVQQLEEVCNLTIDGGVWGGECESAYNQITARPTLQKDSEGLAVRYLQYRLGITYDGIFGNQTDGSLRAFQGNNGLEADGICGPNTWVRLIGG